MIVLSPAETAALAAASRAGIRNFPSTATVKAELRALLARIEAASTSERMTT